MEIVEIDLEEFCSWLCEREAVPVKEAGIWFGSPLALYLSERAGRLYGIDGLRYGPASWPVRFWRSLPRWACVFMAYLERSGDAPLRGDEVFGLLAEVEQGGYHIGF